MDIYKSIIFGIKNISRYFITKTMEYKVHIFVILVVLAIFLYAFNLEISNNKAKGFLDKSFWLDSLLPNIIADMIGIIFTSFIIAGLFARNNKRAEEKRIYGILGRDYQRLINILNRNYLYLLKKDEIYLSSFITDYTVNFELNSIARKKDSTIDFSLLIKTYKAWDVSTSSPVYDNFITMVPKIEEWDNLVWDHLKDVEELFRRKRKMELKLKQLDDNSDEYKIKILEYDKLKTEIHDAVFIDTSIDNNLLDVDVPDAFTACSKLYKSKIQDFYDKYNFIIPIDIRVSFAELDKNLQIASSKIHSYTKPNPYFINENNDIDVKKKEILSILVVISQDLVNLSGYFKNVK
ncbi:hypothetical protein [Bacillus toyonensis]|uniref:hypothetical protein n=2 Tax=Bacillus cereus group TaxID=86661 RepID=UPI000BEDF220|nr:hypothetical protein [Bacillus toyonensis]PEB89754.1 hypothetical protein CON81_29100 [Bacillus toyonensis]PEP20897.1 hypothetical protein CN578_00210 [Bacillus toyonensis]UFH96709.1 hypothetical protein HQN46_0020490 [Bacillus toyonensis]HDR7316722.1 hypothetical protein [Bacillus toyonensis]HDR7478457.1 hypothetical protein [Bacillus toyonensis]